MKTFFQPMVSMRYSTSEWDQYGVDVDGLSVHKNGNKNSSVRRCISGRTCPESTTGKSNLPQGRFDVLFWCGYERRGASDFRHVRDLTYTVYTRTM